MENESLKDWIKRLRLDRKVLASRLQMPYSTFSAKLAGFNRFSPDEEKKLVAVLQSCDDVQKEIAARLDARQGEPYGNK